MPAPVVSICLPTYNGESYLAATLDSILAQTFGDFELLIVDDQSTDGTVSIAERYAAMDDRIRVLRNEHNLGLVGNWNRCVELSRGEWIKFVFQDDLIAPECLERLLDAGSNGQLLVSCARDFIFEPGSADRERNYLVRHKELLESLYARSATLTAEEFSELTLDHMDVNLVGEPTVVLLHRTVFERFGSFNRFMVQIVDGEYWTRVATSAGTAHVPDVLATFRVHPSSTTSLNSTTRSVRARIDPLIVRHEYAFSPSYAALRAVCRERRRDRDLEAEFWRAAYATLVENGTAAALRSAHAGASADFERVLEAYPRLAQIPMRYVIEGRCKDLVGKVRARARRLAGT